jgi:hypothetical protein
MKTREFESFLTQNHDTFWPERVVALSIELADAHQRYAVKGLRSSSALMEELKKRCESAFDDALANYLDGVRRGLEAFNVKPNRKVRTALEVAVNSMLAALREELNSKLAMQPGLSGPRNHWRTDAHVELCAGEANNKLTIILAECAARRKKAVKPWHERLLGKLTVGIAIGIVVTVLGALLLVFIRAYLKL